MHDSQSPRADHPRQPEVDGLVTDDAATVRDGGPGRDGDVQGVPTRERVGEG